MRTKPAVHLICTAHLDPVWQWRWEEGAAEALATFRNAVEILAEYDDFVFCHNEAVLYQWVEEHDPALFGAIRRLVLAGRWAISGGWYLQPDVNLPGAESLIRQIAEGRRYFREKFGAVPRVAYNFDSFGHGGGLPQILKQAGYGMYIHMRPQPDELELPSDLYRWRGVDGSEILAYRIAVGLYHTEHDNIEQRLEAGTALALELGRDVPVFWGIGNHGGGATREDLKKIEAFARNEKRVRIVHSTPDRLFLALRRFGKAAPVFESDLQHVFTGCYTSLSRLKRRARESLGMIVQTEALRAASWWLGRQPYPAQELRRVWRSHLFNDFHDIISGSAVEPAERDALDLYGEAEDSARRLRLGAATAFNRGRSRRLYVPVTVLNANPAVTQGPVEVECMANDRPFWAGTWHLRLFDLDGREIPCQEEQPEALLPFNGWRRKVVFQAGLPGLGGSHYEVRAFKGTRESGTAPRPLGRYFVYKIDKKAGLMSSLAAAGAECLAGPLFRPLVIADDADSWGTGRSDYRHVAGAFRPRGSPRMIESGPVRTVTESLFSYRNSRIAMRTLSYPDWPVIEFRLRVIWNEERMRLKLSIPLSFASSSVLAEIPGGAIERPADGREHVHGRWLMVEGKADGKRIALGLVNSGQHGFDFKDGEVRLSVLRSSAYCHERGLSLGARPVPKFADLGVHDVRLLVTAGSRGEVRRRLPGLADWLSAPPFALAHLPIGADAERREILSVEPENIRLLACKRSDDGLALIVRLQESAGAATRCRFVVRIPSRESRPKSAPRRRPFLSADLRFNPFELKTIRIERGGRPRPTSLIENFR